MSGCQNYSQLWKINFDLKDFQWLIKDVKKIYIVTYIK